MNDRDNQGKSVPGISFHIETKPFRLAHKPGVFANVRVYLYGYDMTGSKGYHDRMYFSADDVTLEQLELFQKMQLEFARQSLSTKGEPHEIHGQQPKDS